MQHPEFHAESLKGISCDCKKTCGCLGTGIDPSCVDLVAFTGAMARFSEKSSEEAKILQQWTSPSGTRLGVLYLDEQGSPQVISIIQFLKGEQKKECQQDLALFDL